jgi:hypothetical protein
MKKPLLLLITLLNTSLVALAQTYSFVDSLSKKPINNVKIRVFENFSSLNNGTSKKQLLKEYNSKEDSKVNVSVKPTTKDGILYFLVEHPDYYEKKVVRAQIENGTINLVRKGVTEEFCIKLATLKKKLTKTEIVKLKSLIDVENIEELKRKDGRYAYITSPIKNLHTCIEQLDRIKSTKNSMAKDAYILHGKYKVPVFFRVQLEVARKWMENEFVTPKYALERFYKLDQIKTTEGLYRVVSEKKYENYKDAMSDYLGKVKLRIPKAKGIIIACKKAGNAETVITPLSIN